VAGAEVEEAVEEGVEGQGFRARRGQLAVSRKAAVARRVEEGEEEEEEEEGVGAPAPRLPRRCDCCFWYRLLLLLLLVIHP